MTYRDRRILRIKTTDDMLRILEDHGVPDRNFKKGYVVHVFNKMEKNYHYVLSENPGKNFDKDFTPAFNPKDMILCGVFSGKYYSDGVTELPQSWFTAAIKKGKMSPQGANPAINKFGVDSRMSLQQWRESGWVPSSSHSSRYPILSTSQNPDERGWFQWFCRYWLGRRIPELDRVQIARWKAFARHAGQIRANCRRGDVTCRPVQRQALLQWSHDPMI